jgi:HEPN domain-containing protein
VAQQAAEKALKALRYLHGERIVIGHSVVALLDQLITDHPALAALREVAQQLDQYYIPTRYPNGLPDGVPADLFTRAQAEGAVAGSQRIIELARDAIGAR